MSLMTSSFCFVDPACERVFPDFLKYLYTGQVEVNVYLVLPLLVLADKYNIKDLVDVCISYMCVHVVKGKIIMHISKTDEF